MDDKKLEELEARRKVARAMGSQAARDRLAAAFQPADRMAEREKVIERHVETVFALCGHDHLVSDAKLGQIRPGAKTVVLARP